MSLGGGIADKEETNIVKTKTSDRKEGSYTGPLFQIRFIVGGGRGIYGGEVANGAILCMLLVDK